MNSIEEVHKKAMRYAQLAFLAEQQGNISEAQKNYKLAFSLENQAAQRVSTEFDFEPTRSVLHRGAATLAFRCNELEAAKKLIGTGLTGNPPIEIVEELVDLLELVNEQKSTESASLLHILKIFQWKRNGTLCVI